MNETIIKVEHVSKEYRLGAIGGGTLKGDLQSAWARFRGKEDPNKKIGQAVYTGNDRFLALNDVSFEVKKGEALGIIGHNGAGKSTLLKLLSRVTAPTLGTISYNGRIASMLEVGTGFHPELTGRENVYLNGAILGMTKAEINRKFDQIVEFAEMEQFIDTPVKRYSSGMYVKLAFAVAAHLDSEIMVMDEVLAVGDMKFQQKCLGRMGDAANQEGRTVLYVSHNMNTIRQLCTRCIVLDHGRVAFDGEVEDAIGVYMRNISQPATYNNCKNISRSGFSLDGKISITSLRFCSVENPIYTNDSSIHLQLELEATQNMENICLRIPVFYGDNTPVGMSASRPVISCKKGHNVLSVHVRPLALAPGRYTLRLVVFSKNEYGAMQNHDVVHNAGTFDIVDNKQTLSGVSWEHQYWGALQLPEIEVDFSKKDISHEKL